MTTGTTEFSENRPDFWLVIDLEATCCNDDSFPREEMEIIEIGAVMADAVTLKPLSEFASFVRPVRHFLLTDFCRQLTGIDQADINSAPGFADVMSDLSVWMKSYPGAMFCSWGNFDRRQFERDCRFHEVDWPFGEHHLNLKSRYSEKFRIKRGSGLESVLRKHKLQFEGRPHRGIDDARNIVRLLPVIFSDSPPRCRPSL